MLARSLRLLPAYLFPSPNFKLTHYLKFSYSPERSLGYGLIFYPPAQADSIDTARLLVQCLGVVIIAGVVFVLVSPKRLDEN
jgi:hypothetical protein